MADTIAKTCNMCSATKPIEEFYINRACKDGRQKRCKDCSKEAVRLVREEQRALGIAKGWIKPRKLRVRGPNKNEGIGHIK